MTAVPKYASLDDFLAASELTVNGQLDDGWGAVFPVKGREIAGTVLFADIRRSAARTGALNPTESLIFLNTFVAWMTAEGLHASHGIIDKYIGDSIMVVFSNEFGSIDPFAEAVDTARRMSESDSHSYRPRLGIASGNMIVGIIGTPRRFNTSVFGLPVVVAARCAGVDPPATRKTFASSAIVFPADEWTGRDFDTVIPVRHFKNFDGTSSPRPMSWRLLRPRKVSLKNLPPMQIREIVNRSFWRPMESAEDRAREGLRILREDARRR